MLKNRIFQHEVIKTTAHFGRSQGIQVVFKGDQPMTDGKTVVLPEIQGNTDLTEDELRIIRGYVDHEAGGHCRFTNPKTIEQAHAEDPSGQLGALLNALEDVRIEKLHCDEYPGAAKNIRATAASVTKYYWEAMKEDPEQAKDGRAVGALAATWLGRTMTGLGSQDLDECLANTPPEMLDMIRPFVERAIKAKDTTSVLKVARELSTLIQEAPPPPPPQPPQPQPNQPPQSQPKDKQEAEGGKGSKGKPDKGKQSKADKPLEDEAEDQDQEGDNEEDDDAKGDKEDGDKDEDTDGEDTDDETEAKGGDENDGEEDEGEEGEASGGGGTQAGAAGGGAGPSQLDTSLKQALKDLAQPPVQQGERFYRRHPSVSVLFVNKDGVKVQGPGNHVSKQVAQAAHLAMQPANEGRKFYEKARAEMAGQVSVAAREFLRLLMGSLDRDRDRGLSVGRLDGRRLTQAYMGNERVFFRNAARPEIDTVVSLITDQSYSMTSGTGGKDMQTLGVVVASEALARAGIPFEVVGYSGRGTGGQGSRLQEEFHRPGSTGYSSHYDPVIMQWKAFDQSLSSALDGLGACTSRYFDGTPMADALYEAFMRIRLRPESRKVMILLTDGIPDHLASTQLILEEVRKEGVVVVGVGMGDQAKIHLAFGPKAQTVTTPDETAKCLIEALRNEILGPMAKGRAA